MAGGDKIAEQLPLNLTQLPPPTFPPLTVLFNNVIFLLGLAVQLIKKSHGEISDYRSIRNEQIRLNLWGDGLSVSAGELDKQLRNSTPLREKVEDRFKELEESLKRRKHYLLLNHCALEQD